MAKPHLARRASKLVLGGGALVFFVLGAAVPASSAGPAQPEPHPSDEGRVETVFRMRGDTLTWTQDWWLGNLVGLRVWSEHIDADRDLKASAPEKEAFSRYVQSWAELRIDGALAEPRLDVIEVADYAAFASLPSAPQVHLEYSLPLSATVGRFLMDYRRAKPDTISFAARFPAGGGVIVSDQHLDKAIYSAAVELRQATAAQPAMPPAAPAISRGAALLAALAAFGIALLALIAMLSLLRRQKKDT